MDTVREGLGQMDAVAGSSIGPGRGDASIASSHRYLTFGNLLMACWAIGGTFLYVIRFRPDYLGFSFSFAWLKDVSLAIGIGAGLGWIVLGLVLYLANGFGAPLTYWFRLCLRVISRGMLALTFGTIANGLGLIIYFPHSLWLHILILLGSDLLMAIAFVRGARWVGVSTRTAWALWILVLNGSFACVLVAGAFLMGLLS